MIVVPSNATLAKDVMIGGVPYKVFLSDELNKDGKDALGILLYEDQEIYVKRAGNEVRQVSLLHEILHVVAVNAGIAMNECDVISLSQSLYDVLTRNPDIFGGLEDEDDD